jgi:transcriptional repressor NrdR
VNCPFCASNHDKVIDSRESDGGKIIRRRRECLACHRRFTTYERIEQTARLTVVKRDGTHVPFSRDSIMRGIQAACGKRPIPEERKEALVTAVEEELHQEFDREVSSSVIGQRVMAKLRDLDEVAYIRYASEHHQFRSVDDLRAELDALEQRTRDVKDQQPLFGAPPNAKPAKS